MCLKMERDFGKQIEVDAKQFYLILDLVVVTTVSYLPYTML